MDSVSENVLEKSVALVVAQEAARGTASKNLVSTC